MWNKNIHQIEKSLSYNEHDITNVMEILTQKRMSDLIRNDKY